jgi:hypothetical protein
LALAVLKVLTAVIQFLPLLLPRVAAVVAALPVNKRDKMGAPVVAVVLQPIRVSLEVPASAVKEMEADLGNPVRLRPVVEAAGKVQLGQPPPLKVLLVAMAEMGKQVLSLARVLLTQVVEAVVLDLLRTTRVDLEVLAAVAMAFFGKPSPTTMMAMQTQAVVVVVPQQV